MDEQHIRIVVIVLLLITAFFLVPSAFGDVEVDPGSSGPATSTPVPIPTPTLHQKYTTERTLRWLPLIAQVAEGNTWLMVQLDIRPEHILSIIAQESFGFVNPHEVFDLPYDRVNSVGLMAVAPFTWRGYTQEQLLNPYINVKVGMNTLLQAYTSKYNLEHDYSLRTALALYNCGDEYLSQDRCGSYGGYAYADKILNYWTLYFRKALVDEQWKKLYAWSDEIIIDVNRWLDEFNTGGVNEGATEIKGWVERSAGMVVDESGFSCPSITCNHGISSSTRGHYRPR